jgi:hypothetical protein
MTPLTACGVGPPPSQRFESMPFVCLVLNIPWTLMDGLWMVAAWLIAGVLQAPTVIGLPWATLEVMLVRRVAQICTPTQIRQIRSIEDDLEAGPHRRIMAACWKQTGVFIQRSTTSRRIRKP